MKHLVLMLCFCLPFAFAQAPNAASTKARSKSAISESFAKAGLRALIAIEDYEGDGPAISGGAKRQYEEAQAEHDPDKPADAQMLGNLVVFDVVHTVNNPRKQAGESRDDIVTQERKCSSELERAFRRRVSIDAPASCTSAK